MGAAEIGKRLGVSRQRVSQIAAGDPTFPKPVADLAAGRIWHSEDVERWVAEHRPDLGPPDDDRS
ncbi:DNA-binding protein [Frankia sp. AgB1.9]|uniref:helix-turn-helix transcriptional regulator n=1 Tax=unclassified Frankia TaxID=2632575 RepID=UPI001933CB6A|nr:MULTISPECIES: DNA-binding protein [unclassified Frankia]MBL7487614.1 DNA-binding protein [Frankia sp. AgW1.1]MBL7548920.1 DNA-binding protein [Frankia sp. AgB1.9]MBL7624888.1 DNA-binding protein [Frankia sp. AgB1.8]